MGRRRQCHARRRPRGSHQSSRTPARAGLPVGLVAADRAAVAAGIAAAALQAGAASSAAHEGGSRRGWMLSHAAIEPPAANQNPPNRRQPQRPTRIDFRSGEKITFEDRYLQTHVVATVRINDRTATIDPGDGTKWRAGFELLRHALDL